MAMKYTEFLEPLREDIGRKSFSSKLTDRSQTQTHTDAPGPTALPGPLKWSATRISRVPRSGSQPRRIGSRAMKRIASSALRDINAARRGIDRSQNEARLRRLQRLCYRSETFPRPISGDQPRHQPASLRRATGRLKTQDGNLKD